MRVALACAEDFNFGIGYLSAFLKKRGDNVKLFFYTDKKLDIGDMVNYAPDFCGISCVTANSNWAYSLANSIKHKIGCKIVLGGVHPTLCPEEVKAEGFEPCSGENYGSV